jgi:hypothetical protein
MVSTPLCGQWIVNEAPQAAEAARSYGYMDLAEQLKSEPKTDTWEEVEQSGHELVARIQGVMNGPFFTTVTELHNVGPAGSFWGPGLRGRERRDRPSRELSGPARRRTRQVHARTSAC